MPYQFRHSAPDEDHTPEPKFLSGPMLLVGAAFAALMAVVLALLLS